MTGSNYWFFWLVVMWGSIVGVLTILAFVQERGIRRVAIVGGWCGIACLGVVALGALALIAIGVL